MRIAEHVYERVHALRYRYERGTTGASGYGLACVAQRDRLTVPISVARAVVIVEDAS